MITVKHLSPPWSSRKGEACRRQPVGGADGSWRAELDYHVSFHSFDVGEHIAINVLSLLYAGGLTAFPD